MRRLDMFVLFSMCLVMTKTVVSDSSSEEDRRRHAAPMVPRRRVQPPTPAPAVPGPVLVERQSSRAWTFAVTYYQKPYVYLKKGRMVGFTVDFIHDVCRIAEKTCYLTYQPAQECSKPLNNVWFPGAGLMRGDFDACIWWPITAERENTVAFTRPYRREKPARWLVKSGNPTRFDPLKLSGSKIVTINGWYPTKVCLESVSRNGGSFVVAPVQQAAHLVTSGNADALFSQLTAAAGMALLPDVVTCTTGSGLMVKKGSALPAWWDDAFAHYVMCGCYKKLCADSLSKHGKSADCLDFNASSCSPALITRYCGP